MVAGCGCEGLMNDSSMSSGGLTVPLGAFTGSARVAKPVHLSAGANGPVAPFSTGPGSLGPAAASTLR